MIDVKEKLLQRMQEPVSDYTDFVLHMASFGEIERLNEELVALRARVKELEEERKDV